MAKKEEKIIARTNKREIIDLKEFMLLDAKKQDEKIKKILNDLYEDKVKISERHIEKVLNICFDVHDNEVYLPGRLKVEKN